MGKCNNIKSGFLGFTLIELLIVISIMAVIIGVIGACLSGGIRVWDSARVFNDLESDAFIAMDIMEKDVKNSLSVYVVGFEGGKSEMSFPGYIDTEKGLGIGIIRYELDENNHVLLRREQTWKGHDLQKEQLLNNIKALDFTYYMEMTSVWQNAGESITNFPDKVEVKVLLGRGEREVLIERKILMPVHGRF
jgi:prepilin-type N-terminal cleavage/methylation domain-containing protein